MKTNFIHIPHQNGELIVSLNENYEAVLCDYIGNAKVLYLPASVSYIDEDGETASYDTSSTIPDLSFGSCSDVEILVCGFETHFEFGDFAFLHCNNLHSIVFLSLHNKAATSADINEFSFANESYIPKQVKKHQLFLGEDWEHYHSHDLYLPDDPQDLGYSEATYAYAEYLGYVFSFMDWLEITLPALIMSNAINPELFLSFIKRYGQYDFTECRNSVGKPLYYFDADTPTLTRCVPRYNENEWIHWNSEQRQSECNYWINFVLKFFSGNSVSNDLLFVTENDEAVITGYIGSEKNLEIPSVLNGKAVVAIGHMAISFNKYLETISLPDSIRTIKPGAFQGCEGLLNMVIPKKVTCISGNSFQDCTSLEHVTLPEGIIEIEASAFRNCKQLVRIPIPESVRKISAMAFSGCSSLPSISIPHGVTHIDDWSFSGCERLSYVSLPDSINSIGLCAFSGCNSLLTLKIPNSVTTIAGTAFNGCHNLTIKASAGSYAASFAQPTIPNPFLDSHFEPIYQHKIDVNDLALLKDLLQEMELMVQNDDNKD